MDVDRIASVLEVHQIEWIGHQEGYTCGCDERGDLPYMPFLADALKHQAKMIVKNHERAGSSA